MTTHTANYGDLFEKIGLPAVRIRRADGEVIDHNKLFALLVDPDATRESRRWFIDSIRPRIAAADNARWQTALASHAYDRIEVSFEQVHGEALDFEMHTFAVPDADERADSIFCIFVPLNGPVLERHFDACRSEGTHLERQRIRDELHKGVSQQLLGAAFAWKVLARKVAGLDDGLGKEASDLAFLLNDAVTELQNLVRS